MTDKQKTEVSHDAITTNSTVKTSHACRGKFAAATVLALQRPASSGAAASTARRNRRSHAAAAAPDHLSKARYCLGVQLRVEAG